MKLRFEHPMGFRNGFLIVGILSALWCLQYVYAPIPHRGSLVAVDGVPKKLQPLDARHRSKKGYRIFMGHKWYEIRLRNFYLNEGVVSKILAGDSVTVLYKPKCYGLCGNEIYEISSRNEKILGYSYVKGKHYEQKERMKKYMWYPILFLLTLGLFFHFYSRHFKR